MVSESIQHAGSAKKQTCPAACNCLQLPTVLSSERGKWKQWHLITIWAKSFSSVSPNANCAYIVSYPFVPLILAAFPFVQVMLIFAGHSPAVCLPRQLGQ